ncbi:hypothetical protein SLA2020_407090 [Shorea laevis]
MNKIRMEAWSCDQFLALTSVSSLRKSREDGALARGAWHFGIYVGNNQAYMRHRGQPCEIIDVPGSRLRVLGQLHRSIRLD